MRTATVASGTLVAALLAGSLAACDDDVRPAVNAYRRSLREKWRGS